jgi:hypothetical protein
MVSLSPDTVGRMNSFFARHRVDLDAVGARSGDDGYPSAGAIAWMLWGGDPNNPNDAGVAWASRKADELASESKGENAVREKMRIRLAEVEGAAFAKAITPDPKWEEINTEIETMRVKTANAERIINELEEILNDES